ncbi:hypothetical protein GCM10009682_37100 [Luedemannella flava]|uniref:Beta-lactamase class A n=1 Tax=Luedemannella flava TaxID=349316 RepID=A0ABN2M763_9ACTN
MATAAAVLVAHLLPSPSAAAAPPAPTTATTTTAPTTATTSSAAPPTTAGSSAATRQAALTRALAALPTGRHGEFSVAVRNNRTGGTYRYRASDTYETASIVKVDILAAVLLRAQDDGRSLTDAERSAATRMIRASDNDAATYLWNRAGGASGVRAANRRLGLTHTTPGTEGWGLTRTTVGDQVTLVNRALGTSGPLTSASRAYIRGLMTTVNGDQDWGVPAAAHRGETAAVKNGWLSRSTENGRWIINSIGRITGPGVDLTVAVLSHGHSGMSTGVALTEQIIKLARQHLAW